MHHERIVLDETGFTHKDVKDCIRYAQSESLAVAWSPCRLLLRTGVFC